MTGADGEAERYLRRLAEAELRRADGVARGEAAAEGLGRAGALDREAADAVLTGFITAWELRGGQADQRARPFLRRPDPGAGAAPLTGPVRGGPVGGPPPGPDQRGHAAGPVPPAAPADADAGARPGRRADRGRPDQPGPPSVAR